MSKTTSTSSPPSKILVKDIINSLPSNNTLLISSDDSLMVLPPANTTRDQKVHLRLSPRIGCMGQIKRSSSCRNSSSNKMKLFQFQRMFSNISGKSTSRGMSARVEVDCSFNFSSRRRRDDDISIADTMDLPLPVLKERRRDAAAGLCSIWERKHGLGGGLQLQGMEHLRESFKDCCRTAA